MEWYRRVRAIAPLSFWAGSTASFLAVSAPQILREASKYAHRINRNLRFYLVFSAWPDYLAHIRLSVNRRLVHVAPLALLVFSAATSRNLAGRAESPVPACLT